MTEIPEGSSPSEYRSKIRVLLVDDSASVRAVLKRFLGRADDLLVVGEAENGEQAVNQVFALAPDVVLMDLVMPVLDGYAATERIMSVRPTPIVVLSSRANRDQMRTAFEAMRRGAVEVLPKPENTEGWHLFADVLPGTVRAAAQARTPASLDAEADPPEVGVGDERRLRYVGVGASTGGPAALREFFAGLPTVVPFAVLVVQHITEGFEEGLADWLNREFRMSIQVAEDGEEVVPGTVRLAPSNCHMVLDRKGRVRLDRASPPRGGHRPSVDELLRSLAWTFPERSAGVLLTGMGVDGVEGLLALKHRGGLTLMQDRDSSVVFGMPRAAAERQAATVALPPRRLAAYLGDLAGSRSQK